MSEQLFEQVSLNLKEKKEVISKQDTGSDLPCKLPDYLQKIEVILTELATEGVEWQKIILKG